MDASQSLSLSSPAAHFSESNPLSKPLFLDCLTASTSLAAQVNSLFSTKLPAELRRQMLIAAFGAELYKLCTGKISEQNRGIGIGPEENAVTFILER